MEHHTAHARPTFHAAGKAEYQIELTADALVILNKMITTGVGELRGGDENVAAAGGSRAGPMQHDIGERILHEGTPRGEAVQVQTFDPEPRVPVLAVRELRIGQARRRKSRDSGRCMKGRRRGKGRRLWGRATTVTTQPF